MAGFSSLFLCRKLLYLIHAVAVYIRPLLRFIFRNFFRVRLKAHDSVVFNKDDKKINFHEQEIGDATEYGDFGVESEEENEPEEIYFKFKFPTFEEFSKTQKETGNFNNCNKNLLNSEVVPPANTSDFDPTIVDEMEEFRVSEEFGQTSGAHEGGEEILVLDGDENETTGAKIEFPENTQNKKQTVFQENELIDENQLSSDRISMISDSDSVMSLLTGPHADGFLSDGDFGGEPDSKNEKTETYSELSGFDDNQDSSDDFSDEDSDRMEKLEKLDDNSEPKNPKFKSSGFLSVEDFNEKFKTDHEKGPRNGEKNIEKTGMEDFPEDANELESLWEHQELIEQLEMELKKVRATGLPTILEESETPKLADDLKPWKIDEFRRESCSGGLHKFYKGYRERMRKFDIINYQKMYAMGFLQLKDPLKSISTTEKPLPPTLKSLVSQNLWLSKHKIHGTDPTRKLVRELQGELEAVYVGQMCLSWEFLHWQYDKVLDLWESDRHGTRQLNEVAGEFQQFQVLVERFLEDEPFLGLRVHNYVKTRCAVRNLLQVPIIREDNLRDKRKARGKATDKYVVTSDMLVETVEESIRIFWQFVRMDKDCSMTSLNGHKKTPELPGPEHLGLFTEIKKTLQKKDRKIKDVLRSKNCILRKFRRCSEGELDDQVLYFFLQVDMKLVCRVLNMSKVTRDQLAWCRNKLDRIHFENGRIRVERAFLLFPC